MKTRTVRNIVQSYLRLNGFGGLFNEDGECACPCDDLFCCDSEGTNICEAGYKVKCTPRCQHEGYEPDDKDCWHIQKSKPRKRK